MTLGRLLLSALLLAPVAVLAESRPLVAAKRTAVTFPDGKTIQADLVDTPVDRERGLMFRRKLAPDYGMLFAFPREMPMQFWMKNTLVSLDIVFIGGDKRITRLHHRVKASTEATSERDVARASGSGQWVLELPAGAAARRKLAVGQTLKFDAAAPER